MGKVVRLLLASVGLAVLVPVAHAQTSITINADSPGIQISSNLFGIFFEEINFAGDGGLYAEMVRNRSLDNSGSPDYWTLVTQGTAAGSISVDSSLLLNTNRLHSLKLRMTSGSGSVGARNAGYWGMVIQSNAVYDLSFYAIGSNGFSGPVSARLESANGSTVYAQTSFSGLTTNWQRFAASLTPSATDTNARVVLSITNTATVWLDVVSLFPEATYHSRTNGLRADLANMLAMMKPSFLRYPGGNFIESYNVANAVRWKKGIGDIAQRPGHLNDAWGYWSTDGFGLHEFLQFCEDMGMEPLYGINCGLMLGYNGSANNTVPMAQMGPWVQDALDLIQYANGDTNTTWGAVRAANGHPAPFNLKYMEIGNENGGSYYNERYALFYDAIKTNYPAMHLIANVWGGIPSSRPVEIQDEHYYTSPGTMASYATKYNSYSRSGPKVFVGEYAVTSGYGTYGNLAAALGEAAFMTGIERNSDVVQLASYAPLFANVNGIQWHPDLIYYDSYRCFGTPSYYVQQMFSQNRGDRVLTTAVSGATSLYVSSSLLQSNDQIIVKAVNTSSTSITTQLRVNCARGLETNAITTVLTSASSLDENSLAQPTRVAPVTNTISGVSTNFQYTFPANSLTIFRFQELPAPPVAGFSASPTNGVAPLAVTFINTSTGNVTNGFWNFGDGDTTNTTATSLDYTYSTGGTYTVSLTMSGPGGSNTSTRSNYIVVTNPPPPVAGFSGSPTNGVAPLAVTFTNTSTGSITNGFWNFGDGNTTNTTATGMSHTYSAGTYTVSLTVGGLGGNDTSALSNYIVAITPAHLVVSPGSRNYGTVTVGQSRNQTFSVINTGQQTLTGSASVGSPFAIISGNSYSVPGNGTNTVTVGFSPVAAGSFTSAVLFASNGGNSTNAVTGTALTPAQLRVSPASYNFGTLATGTTAQASFVVTNAGGSTLSGTATVGGPPSGGFAVASGNPFNLAGFASTNVAVSFTPPSAGTFSNSVVFASNGGSSTNAVTGSGAIVPIAQFTGSPTNGMAPLVVTFSNLSTGTITAVAWNFGDGHTSTATNPTHTYSNVATFSVSLTVTGPVGSNTLNRSGYITVGNPLAPVITTGPTVTNALLQVGNLAVVGVGDTNVFIVGAMDPGGNQLSYRWLFGDGVTNVWSLSSVAQHAYTTNCGPYAASVTVSNGWTAISSNLTVAIACQLTITKMQVKWNFAPTNSDSCTLTAALDLGSSYNLTNKVVTVDVGGAQVAFTLDAKGRGVSRFGSCNLAYNKKTRQWTLSANLAKGTWRVLWAAHGLVNKTVRKPGVWVTMPVVVVIGDDAFADERPMLYTATFNKSGSAK